MRVFKNLLFFIILFFILAGMSDKIEKKLMDNDSFVRERNKSIYRILREPENSIDVLVVGDSLSYCSVSPMELWNDHGMAAYVCGQSGQKIQEAFHMLKTVFRTQAPRLVILETDVLFKNQTGIEGIKNVLGEWVNYHLPLIREHDIWKVFLTGKRYSGENYKGFRFRSLVNPYERGKYMVETREKQQIPDMVRVYMDGIVELCERNGTELLLLSTPSPDNYDYPKHNSIEEYAEKHMIGYLDMNLKLNEIGINWKTDSLDQGDHLNFSGAQKVTGYLGQYLKNKYDLPDHRGENFYRSWEEEAQKYHKKAEKCLKKIKKKDNQND